MVQEIKYFVTSDNQQFTIREAAEAHQKSIDYKNSEEGKRAERERRLLNSYSVRVLLKDNSLSTVAIWLIYGEDSDADFGGHMPLLDTVEGTLHQAIRYAIDLPNFYTWGAGGDIKKLPPITKLT